MNGHSDWVSFFVIYYDCVMLEKFYQIENYKKWSM